MMNSLELCLIVLFRPFNNDVKNFTENIAFQNHTEGEVQKQCSKPLAFKKILLPRSRNAVYAFLQPFFQVFYIYIVNIVVVSEILAIIYCI